jgi:hypothetical protein
VLNKVETRFKLPPDQIDMLVTAGRDALSVNPKFRAFVTSLGRAPPPPPAPQGAPVATSDSTAQRAAVDDGN